MPRSAYESERDELHGIWNDIFKDNPSFTDWFFSERFIPEFSTVETSGGKIVSCLHSYPLKVRVRNSLLPSSIVSGVATLPSFRGRGLMKNVMKFHLSKMRSMGIPISVHHPESMSIYSSLGQYATADYKYVKLKKGALRPFENKCSTISPNERIQDLFACYTDYSKNYSGIIVRSQSDFSMKMRDYLSDGGKCAVYEKSGRVSGYCVYYERGEFIYGEEFVSLNMDDGQALFEALALIAAGKDLTVKCAPDTNINLKDAEFEVIPSSVTAVCSAGDLIKAIGLRENPYSIEIWDKIAEENNGVYFCSGEKSNKKGDISISSGHLAQWAVGYKSMSELVFEKNAVVNNPDCLDSFEKVPKMNCFIFDEY